MASCARSLEDLEICHKVWQETQEQLEKGWLTGPYTEEQLDLRHGGTWVPSKRFGIRQSGKIRCIDDCSEFLVNSSTSVPEKLDLEALDQFVALARFWAAEICGRAGERVEPAALVGRCMDLKSAYKQLCRKPEHAWASVVAVLNPDDGSVSFFEAVALPFGATSAVLSFNRAARAIRDILIKLFFLPSTSFFDDYGMLELRHLGSNNQFLAESVLKLLGWEIAMDDHKRMPFQEEFPILGAMVSLKNAPQGEVCVFNKPERVPDIVALFRDIASGSAPLGKLPSLRGKLLYAAGHTFGRMTHLAVQLLSRMGNERNHSIEDLIPFIGEAVSLLQAAAPRVLKPMMCERPILLFTDGACEDEGKVVTHGAMLFDPHHGIREYFGDHVPRHLAEQWSASGSKQLIAQAELLPVVVAKRTWSQVLKGRKVLVFIDNEGVKASLVRSFSPSLHTLSLLRCNAMLDTQFQMWNWYSRVPSASNPTDAASRLELKGYDGWRKVTTIRITQLEWGICA